MVRVGWELGKKWIREKPFFCFLAVSLLSVVIFVFGVFIPGNSRWTGYYQVLLMGEQNLQSTVETLERAGMGPFLSEVSTLVSLSAFSSLEKVSIQQLPLRLYPEDPRFDDFLSRVPHLFQSASPAGSIVYFPVRYHPILLYSKLAIFLEGKTWMLADWSLGLSLSMFSFFLLFVIFVSLQNKHSWVVRILLAIPWVLPTLLGEFLTFAFSMWCYLLLTKYSEETLVEIEQLYHFRRKHNLKMLGRELSIRLSLLCGIMLLFSYPYVWISILYGIFLSFLLFTVILFYRLLRLLRREHRIFLPLPILPYHWRQSKPNALTLGLLVLCLVPLIHIVPSSRAKIFVPTPGGNSIHRFFIDRSDYKDLWVLHKQDRFPNVSDFIVHLKYQRGFAYGASFSFPSLDETLEYPRFKKEGDRLVLWRQIVATYDETWYKETLQIARNDALGNLLYRQGVRATVLNSMNIRPSVEQIVVYFATVLLMVFSSFGLNLNVQGKVYLWVQEEYSRRKQQEA